MKIQSSKLIYLTRFVDLSGLMWTFPVSKKFFIKDLKKNSRYRPKLVVWTNEDIMSEITSRVKVLV